MKRSDKALTVVGSIDLPEYPIDKSERLESHFYVEWHFNRWLSSAFRLLADPAVRGIGFDLFCAAQNEAPVGTLPCDERLLCRLAGVDLETWHRLNQLDITPLHNWTPCRCGDERRLMHPVVTEMAEKALKSKRAASERARARRDAKRLKDLQGQVEAVGGGRVLKHPGNLERIDVFLSENHTGNRTEQAVRNALDSVFS